MLPIGIKVIMKTIKQFFEAIALKQLLVVLLVGVLLFTSTACRGRVQAASSPADRSSYQPEQGMYPTTDIQKGRDTSASDAKAERLIRNVKQPTNKSFTEQAKDLGQSAQEAAEQAAEGTQKGLENIKENTENAIDKATDVINN